MEPDLNLLDQFNRRQAAVRDRVRGVALGSYTGFYLFGPPGNAKTFTVRTALDAIGSAYVYVDGHLTAMGLFELMAKHPSGTLVLDDVSALFRDRVGLQIFLAALGKQPYHQGSRLVTYKRQGRE